MKFEEHLIKGTVKGIYKNIIIDVELDDGSLVPCFCYIDGILKTFELEGCTIYMSVSPNKLRKIKYQSQIIEKDGALIAVNPRMNIALFKEAIVSGVIKDFANYKNIKSVGEADDIKYANFELTDENGGKLYLYIDSIYRKVDDKVVFPSMVNFMQINILEEFRSLRENGAETALVFVVPRGDCVDAKFVWNIDPVAAAKIFDETTNGLKIYCYGCKVTPNSVEIYKKLNVV